MTTTELDAAELSRAVGAIPHDQPVFMLNLLRYKHRAAYGDDPDQPEMTGREAYHRNYRAAFRKVADGIEIRIAWFGPVHIALVAPTQEAWDEVAIIEYADFAAFRRIVEDPRYLAEADRHRRAALEDWRLIAIGKAAS